MASVRRCLEAVPVVGQAVIVVAPTHVFPNRSTQVERATCSKNCHFTGVDLFGKLPVGMEHHVVHSPHRGLPATTTRHDAAGPAHRNRDLALHRLLRQQYGVQRAVRL